MVSRHPCKSESSEKHEPSGRASESAFDQVKMPHSGTVPLGGRPRAVSDSGGSAFLAAIARFFVSFKAFCQQLGIVPVVLPPVIADLLPSRSPNTHE